MLCQSGRISDPGSQCHRIGILRRLHDSNYLDILSMFHNLFHIGFIVGFISPYLILTVVYIVIRTVDQFKFDAQEIFIRVASHILRGCDILFIDKLPDHLVQFHRISKTQGVEKKITHTAVGHKNNDTFMLIFRPAPCFDVVLSFVKRRVFRHLIEHICTHHGGHHCIRTGC